MEKHPAVYMVTNAPDGVLYTGVTSNLMLRVYQHKEGAVKGFTQKYKCKHLVYYELCETMENAILREKEIKGWLRKKKIGLIEATNPEWHDLYDEICGVPPAYNIRHPEKGACLTKDLLASDMASLGVLLPQDDK